MIKPKFGAPRNYAMSRKIVCSEEEFIGWSTNIQEESPDTSLASLKKI
jgi:hypothetical protein